MLRSSSDRRPWRGARRAVGLRVLFGLASMAAASAGTGCGAACDTSDQSNPPELYSNGHTTMSGYESSSWESSLLPFPGGKQYQLEHHLGFTPSIIGIYFSFGPDGEPVSPCAGNSCVVRCVDDRIIWIENDTCSDFWVRVATTGQSFENLGTSCTGGPADAGLGGDLGLEETDSSVPEASSVVEGDASADGDGSSIESGAD